ncbi:MAG: 2,3-bisphosphoglycerate-independent phosphoglycerate mutase [Clostridiales bacterium]|nr:2,3-bisphosphoglycerate-independent phosphoglycerate mutase [Clostridiales bacterium]
MAKAGKPLLLMILDGWGLKTGLPGDALALARTPNFDRAWQEYPRTTLGCSGNMVGLPEGQMGDSEVGHMNIGAGRVVYQDMTRISRAIDDGIFFRNPEFVLALNKAKQRNGKLHLFGLLSDGGIHSHISHLFALLRLAKLHELEKVFIHCFTDGRDTPPRSALEYIAQLEEAIASLGLGEIASVGGRFYGMDRDKRWDRTAKAYNALVTGDVPCYAGAEEAVRASYAAGMNDEFIKPCLINSGGGELWPGRIENHDSVIFFNYRSDRARQLSHAFCDADFAFFERARVLPGLHFTGMTSYDDSLKARVAFPPAPPANTLGKVLSQNGKRQLRIAETEKYAHVTFFFNGGVERMEAGEDRVMIPSPNVTTYDLKPEMSASLLTRTVIDRIESGIYDVIILNFANPDMLGHTGNLEATAQALEAVDACLGQIEEALRQAGGQLLITADHGNVERMRDENGKPVTKHTTGRVPFILLNDAYKGSLLREDGDLQDIAPTVLHLLNLKQPAEMTGHTLIVKGLQQYDQLSLDFS